MSWSEGFRNVTIEEFVGAEPTKYTAAHPPHLDQFEAARDVALVLIESGVVGDPTKFRFNIGLNGHGNIDHEPDAAWTNDFVNIMLAQTEAIDAGTEDQTA